MKLCKDCRWFRPQGQGEKPLCGHPTSINPARISRVTGDTIPAYQYDCASLRAFQSFNGFCGEEAKHWEPADIAPVGFT
jgi:hypothetical protein